MGKYHFISTTFANECIVATSCGKLLIVAGKGYKNGYNREICRRWKSDRGNDEDKQAA